MFSHDSSCKETFLLQSRFRLQREGCRGRGANFFKGRNNKMYQSGDYNSLAYISPHCSSPLESLGSSSFQFSKSRGVPSDHLRLFTRNKRKVCYYFTLERFSLVSPHMFNDCIAAATLLLHSNWKFKDTMGIKLLWKYQSWIYINCEVGVKKVICKSHSFFINTRICFPVTICIISLVTLVTHNFVATAEERNAVNFLAEY